MYYSRCPRCGRGVDDTPNGYVLKLYTHECCGTIFCSECVYENMIHSDRRNCQFCDQWPIGSKEVVGIIRKDSDGRTDFQEIRSI
jgi:hypothetical protein